MFHGHEDGVEDDADDDPEVKERVHDKGLEALFEPPPTATTVPLEEEVGEGEPTRRTRAVLLLRL